MEFLHLSALAPLAWLYGLRWLGARHGVAWWWLAAAFALSWAGDSMAHYAGGAWWPSYLWLPAQVGLALVACRPTDRRWAADVALGMMLLTGASAAVSAPGPEWLVTALGSLALLVAVRGPIRVPVWLYFGVGSGAYLAMLGGDAFTPAWTTYQAARLTAYAAFLVLATREASWARS